MRPWLSVTALLFSVACARPAAPATTLPTRACDSAWTPRDSYERTPVGAVVRAERSRKRAFKIKTQPVQRSATVAVGAPTIWEASAIGADVPRYFGQPRWCVHTEDVSSLPVDVPSPFVPSGVRGISLSGAWFEGDGAFSASYSMRRDVHAEQRSRRNPQYANGVMVVTPQGNVRGLWYEGSGETLRTSSGVFVVQPRGRRDVVLVESRRGWPAPAFSGVAFRGPFVLRPDGSTASFPLRLKQMRGWGDNRIWGLSPGGRRLLASDLSGEVFFRRALGRGARTVLVHAQGACVVFNRGRMRCYDLLGAVAADLVVHDAWYFVVDAAGYIYAVGPSYVSAFEPNGTLRWKDEVPTHSGAPWLDSAHGLCTIQGDKAAGVVCYGGDPWDGASRSGTTAMRARSAPAPSTN